MSSFKRSLITRGLIRQQQPDSTPAVNYRYFRRNAGTTDAYEIGSRLIPNPLDHFDVEFELVGITDAAGTFVAQNLTTTTSNKAFQIYKLVEVSVFTVLLGGAVNAINTTASNGTWRFAYDGTILVVYKEGLVVETIVISKGIYDEPTATTTLSARHDNTLTSYGNNYAGIMANVKFRNPAGELTNSYAIDDNNDTITDTTNGQDGTVINGVPEDWALYEQQSNGGWLGPELLTTPITFGKIGTATEVVPEGLLITGGDHSAYRIETTFPAIVGKTYEISVDTTLLSGSARLSYWVDLDVGIGLLHTCEGHSVFTVRTKALSASPRFRLYVGYGQTLLHKLSVREIVEAP